MSGCPYHPASDDDEASLCQPPEPPPDGRWLRLAAEAGHRLARAINTDALDLRFAGRTFNPARRIQRAIDQRVAGVDPRLPREILGTLGAVSRGPWLASAQAPVFAARHAAARARARAETAAGRSVDPRTPDGDTWVFTVPNLPLVRFRGPDVVDTGYTDTPGPLLAIHCVKGPTALREMFTNPNFDRGGVPFHVLAQAIGTPSVRATPHAQGAGLFAGRFHGNQTWQDDRRLTQRLLGPRALEGLVPGMEAALDDVVAALEVQGDAPIDGTVLMTRIAFRMILRAAFGAVDDARFERLGQRLREAMRALLRYFVSPRYLTDPDGMMRTMRDAKAALAEMCAIVRRRHAEGALADPQRHAPLLDFLLHGTDGEPPSDDRLYTLLVPILFGGHETTGFTLAWALLHLGRDPELERRYLDELAAFRADHPDAAYTPAHDDERPLQQALLYEINRRYPPVFNVPRTAREAGAVGADPDTGIGAFAYPAHALFLAAVAAVHHDPENYPDPLRFDVERWLDGTAGRSRVEAGRVVRRNLLRAEGSFRYLAFAAGPGKCLGQPFNQLEVNRVLDRLLPRFRFELVAPWREVRQTRETLSGPEPGSLAVRIRRRDAA